MPVFQRRDDSAQRETDAENRIRRNHPSGAQMLFATGLETFGRERVIDAVRDGCTRERRILPRTTGLDRATVPRRCCEGACL
jgi:hypothetical protein